MSKRNLFEVTAFKVLAGAVLFLAAGAISAVAQAPSFAGTWRMDPAKSQVSDGRTVTMVIEQIDKKVKVTSTIVSKAGQESTVEFVCGVDGKECEFNDSGHKSKVSMWYSGETLNTCKTDGPAGDMVNEWKLERSADGKTLKLTVNHIDPVSDQEVLVFTKK